MVATPASLPGIDWGEARPKPLLLLSLQPRYWTSILDGSKRYEFRRAFRSDAVRAFVYLSSPRQEVAGFIQFDAPIVDTPARIADLAEEQRPGSREGMLGYLQGCDKGFAIPILSCEELAPGIPRRELAARFGLVAPQHYLVLDKHPALRDLLLARHGHR